MTTRSVLGVRDLRILQALWRWKVLTTASIAQAHFGRWDSDYAYRRLQRLRRNRLVELVPLGDELGHAWGLTIGGFHIVRDLLPPLKENVFRSQAPYHDLIAVALQCGDTLPSLKTGMELVTDAELLCLPEEVLPSWVPRSDLHRPDGYTKLLLSGQESIIAFEVERSKKTKARYQTIFAHYAIHESIYRVIWLLPNRKVLTWFESVLRRHDPDNADIHLLVDEEDFFAKLWDAPILYGKEKGRSLSHFLSRNSAINVSLNGLSRDTSPVLNFQKRPFITAHYARLQKTPLGNCIASSACSPTPLIPHLAHSIPNDSSAFQTTPILERRL